MEENDREFRVLYIGIDSFAEELEVLIKDGLTPLYETYTVVSDKDDDLYVSMLMYFERDDIIPQFRPWGRNFRPDR